MSAALEIRNLKFSYSNRAPVIDIESLAILKGERVFIYGPSGCGKTTLLGLIAGILDFVEGSVVINGIPQEGKSHAQRDRFRGAHMGYIFQMFNLVPYLNAYENIVLPCRLNRERLSRVKGPLKEAVTSLAGSLGIAHILDRGVAELSVGQQQRVAAARALLGHPELIIADEPTSSLDSEHRQAFLDALLLQASNTGATVLFVSHDRAIAEFFDRSICIPEINRIARVRDV